MALRSGIEPPSPLRKSGRLIQMRNGVLHFLQRLVRSERNQLAANSLILFSYFPRKKPVYPTLYLRLYPRAETGERSSIPSLNC